MRWPYEKEQWKELERKEEMLLFGYREEWLND
jgi:hypothetical protein